MTKNNEYYSRGVDAARRIVDIMEGRECDRDALEEELKAPEYESLVAKLSDAGEISRGVDRFRRPEARREASLFRSRVARRGVLRRIAAVSTVAAAITVLALGGWYFMERIGKEDELAVVRASDDVVLTLPDGSRVVLDRAAGNSRVAELDHVTLAMEDGMLVSEALQSSGEDAQSVDVEMNTINIPRGDLFNLRLTDGTSVWLNANSKLRFPARFPQGERRVWLEGEAYFEVSPDAERPFLVETEEQTINVLGTRFNVYAYPGAGLVLTTLVEGSVSVKAHNVDAATVLRPGQQARLSGDGYAVAEVDAAAVASWRERIFMFDDNTLGMVFDKLSRWYDFEYVFEDPGTAGTVMTGSIPVDYDFETVLGMINASEAAHAELDGKVVTIRSK